MGNELTEPDSRSTIQRHDVAREAQAHAMTPRGRLPLKCAARPFLRYLANRWTRHRLRRRAGDTAHGQPALPRWRFRRKNHSNSYRARSTSSVLATPTWPPARTPPMGNAVRRTLWPTGTLLQTARPGDVTLFREGFLNDSRGTGGDGVLRGYFGCRVHWKRALI